MEAAAGGDARTVLEGRSYLGAPRRRDGRLYLSDSQTHDVVSVCEDGNDLRGEAIVPQQPSGLGWLPDDPQVGRVHDDAASGRTRCACAAHDLHAEARTAARETTLLALSV